MQVHRDRAMPPAPGGRLVTRLRSWGPGGHGGPPAACWVCDVQTVLPFHQVRGGEGRLCRRFLFTVPLGPAGLLRSGGVWLQDAGQAGPGAWSVQIACALLSGPPPFCDAVLATTSPGCGWTGWGVLRVCAVCPLCTVSRGSPQAVCSSQTGGLPFPTSKDLHFLRSWSWGRQRGVCVILGLCSSPL